MTWSMTLSTFHLLYSLCGDGEKCNCCNSFSLLQGHTKFVPGKKFFAMCKVLQWALRLVSEPAVQCVFMTLTSGRKKQHLFNGGQHSWCICVEKLTRLLFVRTFQILLRTQSPQLSVITSLSLIRSLSHVTTCISSNYTSILSFSETTKRPLCCVCKYVQQLSTSIDCTTICTSKSSAMSTQIFSRGDSISDQPLSSDLHRPWTPVRNGAVRPSWKRPRGTVNAQYIVNQPCWQPYCAQHDAFDCNIRTSSYFRRKWYQLYQPACRYMI